MSALLDMRCVQVAVHIGRRMSYLPPKSIRDLEQRCRIRDLEQARGRRLEASTVGSAEPLDEVSSKSWTPHKVSAGQDHRRVKGKN